MGHAHRPCKNAKRPADVAGRLQNHQTGIRPLCATGCDGVDHPAWHRRWPDAACRLALTAATATARLLCGTGNRILGGRAAGDGHLDLHQLFDLAQQICFVRRAEGNCLAFTARTGGPADAVDVVIRAPSGSIVVDDVGYAP